MKYEVMAMTPTGKVWKAGVLSRPGDPEDGQASREPLKIGNAEGRDDGIIMLS